MLNNDLTTTLIKMSQLVTDITMLTANLVYDFQRTELNLSAKSGAELEDLQAQVAETTSLVEEKRKEFNVLASQVWSYYLQVISKPNN
jgi:archaellum component FlaC